MWNFSAAANQPEHFIGRKMNVKKLKLSKGTQGETVKPGRKHTLRTVRR